MAIWNVYIDEAGDEGFKIAPTFVGGQGSSRWFIITAVVVAAEADRQVASSLNRIKSRLWPSSTPQHRNQHSKPLHWKELKHSQKKLVLGELRSEQFTWMAVAFEKCHPKLDRTKFEAQQVRKIRPDLKTPLYNYATRFLFERLTRLAQATNRQLDVTFENRASLSIVDVMAYLKLLETLPGPFGPPTIPPGVIANVTAQAKINRKMLQLADACAGALNNALEPNQFGDVEESYIKALAPKLHRPEGKLWGYGLKLFPGDVADCVGRVSAYNWMNDL
jgi:hypothetical protein